MMEAQRVYDLLRAEDINFYTGVPDSLLKDFCACVMNNTPREQNIIAANEGTAIGIAAGYYLSTGKIPVVYMQNSGIGNAINPLLSLMDKKVYGLPVLLFVGWRGEPGVKDEPQHIKQGEVTLALFEAMKIPYTIVDAEEKNAIRQIQQAIHDARAGSYPCALIIRKNIFSDYKFHCNIINRYELSREEALELVINNVNESDVIVSTTGKLSRELFESRERSRQGHERDFLTVGSMGHSSSIALGIALEKPERNVYCLDGDGAFIMHMGSLGCIGDLTPKRFRHIVFNNGAHESVGGQPTVAFNLDIPMIAKGCGYKQVFHAEKREEILAVFKQMQDIDGPVLLEIKVGINSRENLGRPTTTPQENKDEFMDFLKD